MGLGDWISGAVSATIDCVSKVISSSITKVLPTIGTILEKGLEILETVCKIAEVVARIYNIFKAEERTEEIGDRAIQAGEQGITPDKFDKFEDYMEKIRNFPLDPEKSKDIRLEQKLTAGLFVATKGLDDKFNTPEGTMGNLWLLSACKPEYFTAERLKSILDQTPNISAAFKYFEGTLAPAEILDTKKQLINAEKALDPGKDDKTIYAELDSASKAVQGK